MYEPTARFGKDVEGCRVALQGAETEPCAFYNDGQRHKSSPLESPNQVMV